MSNVEQSSLNKYHELCSFCCNPISCAEVGEHTCGTCGQKNKIRHKEVDATVSYSLTALILYIPANIMPFMNFEMYGRKTTSNIWSGIVTLSEGGSWAIAVVVFLASMLVPFIKLAALFYLSFTAKNGKHKMFKTRLYKFIKVIGPWSMLDIFLLAILIAVIKFDNLANVSAGPGAYLFLLVVILTMFASANFDPRLIWSNHDKKDEA